MPKIQIVVSEPEEFTDLCDRQPLGAGGKLYACNTEQYQWTFPWWFVNRDRVPLLVINALQPEDHQRMLVIHESLHWLERCSGKGIDFDHADERVWVKVKGQAQRLYAEALNPSPSPALLATGAEPPTDLSLSPSPVYPYTHWSPSERTAGSLDTSGTPEGPPASEAGPNAYTPACPAYP
jgi:hypothetical protein